MGSAEQKFIHGTLPVWSKFSHHYLTFDKSDDVVKVFYLLVIHDQTFVKNELTVKPWVEKLLMKLYQFRARFHNNKSVNEAIGDSW